MLKLNNHFNKPYRKITLINNFFNFWNQLAVISRIFHYEMTLQELKMNEKKYESVYIEV
jgi:hypothetical protein